MDNFIGEAADKLRVIANIFLLGLILRGCHPPPSEEEYNVCDFDLSLLKSGDTRITLSGVIVRSGTGYGYILTDKHCFSKVGLFLDNVPMHIAHEMNERKTISGEMSAVRGSYELRVAKVGNNPPIGYITNSKNTHVIPRLTD